MGARELEGRVEDDHPCGHDCPTTQPTGALEATSGSQGPHLLNAVHHVSLVPGYDGAAHTVFFLETASRVNVHTLNSHSGGVRGGLRLRQTFLQNRLRQTFLQSVQA